MSEIAELELHLEMLKKKEAEDKLTAKRPSRDCFIHNTNVIECLDRFTSSEVVLPIPRNGVSGSRINLCQTNARQDVLAWQQAEGLRAYLEALHRNVVILEKRLATLEKKTGHK